MNYFWGIERIKEDRKQLRKMIAQEENIQKRMFLSHSLAIADSILFDLLDEKSQSFSNVIEESNYYQEQLQDYDYYQVYFPYIKAFYQYRNIESQEPIFEQSKNTLSKEDAFKAVEQFIYTLQEKYRNPMITFHAKRQNYIRFSNLYENPTTTFIPGVNHPYITLPKREKDYCYEDIINITHEYAHALFAMLYPERYMGKNNLLVEVESHFLELISSDFYTERLKTKAFYQENYHLFCGYLEQAKLTINGKRIIEEFRKRPFCEEEEFLSFLATKKIKVPIEMRRYTFDIKNLSQYLVSYLIAVELYMTYQENPSLAWKKLESLVESKTEEEQIETIEKEIKPNQKIKSYYQQLKQKL